ncbi:MAG: tripartite tricarboxylate transporter substrate binding protein [Betaproteobacteria bacterium]
MLHLQWSRSLLLAVAAAALTVFTPAVVAQDAFPSRPIKLIVPVAPGGGIDTAFRLIAPVWSELLGQPIVIENKPGGGQIVGSDIVAKAKPDGYTLLAPGVPIAFNTALGRKLPYDALKDFTPISWVVSQPLLIVTNPAVPVKNIQELIAFAKAQPAPLLYTSGGIGSYGHLWWEMFRGGQNFAGTHVAYNGIAPALKDVMGGQVPLVVDAIVPSGAQVKAGTVRGLAIVSAKRASMLPDVPTLTEQGFTGFDAAPFYGVLGPAGMDPAVVQKLNMSLVKALAQPAVRDKLQDMGFDVVGSTSEVYAKLIRNEIERWSRVVAERGIKVD